MDQSPTNAYSKKPLTDQVSGAFSDSLNGAQDLSKAGAGAMSFGADLGVDAANGFKSAGTIDNTDLTKYMNPFTKNVIDSSMSEFDRQQALAKQGVSDAAIHAGAFGGDRQAVENSNNTRNFATLRAKTISDLNSSNFSNAQTQAQNDITNRTNSAKGIGDVGNTFATTGKDLAATGQAALSQGSNLGFGWGQQLGDTATTQGAAAQAMVQKIMDAAKAQFGGFTGQGSAGLEQLIKFLGVGTQGAGTTTSQDNPGILGGIGGILGLLGGL